MRKYKGKKIVSIEVVGRRWFERTNGNTYHSVVVGINGEIIGATDYAYGYESHYKQTATEIIERETHLKMEQYDNGGQQRLWQFCQDHGINLFDQVIDVERKKDL